MISIIIPTYNAEEYLDVLLKKLLTQTIFEYELIIIDSSSKDDTVKLAKNYTDNVIVIPQSAFDHGGTRTQAAKLAKGSILVFLTQDALPLNVKSIKKLVDVFKDKTIGAAYGCQLPYPETNLFGKHLRQFNYSDTPYIRTIKDKRQFGIKTAFLSNSFAAYRCSAMDEISWFKDGLILGEDTYAGAKLLKAGYKLAYVADAKVYHSHSYTVWQEFKRYFDIGVFHKMEAWTLEEFGKPNGEGLLYIKSEFNYLMNNKAYFLIPEFLIRNSMKLLGYKIGLHYTILPHKMIKIFSMHHRWWNKFWKNN